MTLNSSLPIKSLESWTVIIFFTNRNVLSVACCCWNVKIQSKLLRQEEPEPPDNWTRLKPNGKRHSSSHPVKKKDFFFPSFFFSLLLLLLLVKRMADGHKQWGGLSASTRGGTPHSLLEGWGALIDQWQLFVMWVWRKRRRRSAKSSGSSGGVVAPARKSTVATTLDAGTWPEIGGRRGGKTRCACPCSSKRDDVRARQNVSKMKSNCLSFSHHHITPSSGSWWPRRQLLPTHTHIGRAVVYIHVYPDYSILFFFGVNGKTLDIHYDLRLSKLYMDELTFCNYCIFLNVEEHNCSKIKRGFRDHSTFPNH